MRKQQILAGFMSKSIKMIHIFDNSKWQIINLVCFHNQQNNTISPKLHGYFKSSY